MGQQAGARLLERRHVRVTLRMHPGADVYVQPGEKKNSSCNLQHPDSFMEKNDYDILPWLHLAACVRKQSLEVNCMVGLTTAQP